MANTTKTTKYPINEIKRAMFRVFQTKGSEGEKVWEHLAAKFYDTAIYSKGDSHDTAYRLGQRDVILYIINCMYTANQSDGEPIDPAE